MARISVPGVVLSGALLAWSLATKGNEPVDESAPHAAIEAAAIDLVEIIRESAAYYDEEPDRYYRAVAAVLEPIVDFDQFARAVMGSHATHASTAQQERFAAKVKDSLMETYGRALRQFDIDTITVLPGTAMRENQHNVPMQVHTVDGRSYELRYTMRQDAAGKWLVQNIMIGDGINMGAVYRFQFLASAPPEPTADRREQPDQYEQALATYRPLLDQTIAAWGGGSDPVAAELEDAADD